MARSQVAGSSELSVGRMNRSLWHRSGREECLGCYICPDHDICGGLRQYSEAFDCMTACDCKDPVLCGLMCPQNPTAFIARLREVNGLGLHDVRSAPAAVSVGLPSCVPLLYHKSRRTSNLNTEVVAVPLSKLFHGRSGEPRFSSREALAEGLGFSPKAQLVLTGVDHDQPLENYWSRARRAGLPNALSVLEPSVITTPNFSLFTDVPRWDNLYNLKRIAICWYELADLGYPTALHVNARTDRDWDRWTEFLRWHPEITAVAFEFKTGGANVERGRWHTGKLLQLAACLDRPLKLMLRGGQIYLTELRRAFRQVVFISADPFLKTTKRRKLMWAPGSKPKWISVFTLDGQPLDELLQHNVDTYLRMMGISDQTSNTIYKPTTGSTTERQMGANGHVARR